ncbi:MAG: hypothetical protein AUG51_12525 [Acidobacteria bacterium 13_1_20CM_3_53_8]|nr:MAG: hypothetical protein AUG51_12525 [Acidobacteria bacterium 13_1_20CM_3_53_8]
MNIVTVTSERRIDRLIFHPAAEYDHEMHIGNFTCRHCGAEIQFNTSDFERHFLSRHSNLDPVLSQAFDEVRPLNTESWECFLDFNCFACGAPARIAYNPVEYRMGSFYYKLAVVLEAEEWNGVPLPKPSA